jgi:hypothetical protein
VTVSAQPFTKTNSMSLKGKEISIGESIIIPNAIKTLETTISITRKGRNNKKPMVKQHEQTTDCCLYISVSSRQSGKQV